MFPPPPPKESELTFHSEVCYLLVYYYFVVHMYFFLSIPMIIASSNIQQKVLEVRKQWAGEGRTACALAGLRERKAAAGAEQEEKGAAFRALAQEMGVRPDCQHLEVPAAVSVRAGGSSAGQRMCFCAPFATLWCLSARKFTKFKIFKVH